MRVVLDTNVLVAALLTQGAAAQVVDLWLEGRYTLLTAEVQLRELRRVLRDKFPELPRAKVGRLVNLLRRQAEVVARPRPPGLSPDPDDDLLLGLALAGRADCLVTGDKSHLLSLKVKGLRILSVRSFLREVS
ncbi:putative toxin-antitoxin system toxin component, PIN family [Thermus arciformis]|uniref:Putative toxin-antitoxin system toxin component, PIN family n=1 Tax=Thermus arciformis TaxID=482827 RepID=A0A1G7CIS5_9DEIN|nr:putative toxin-antitoxin system toxin component, PIN family [Thermus arciformis]SDE39252.1 putative toxin-antitoxin system toxin component, PIN family [Thermus arciformis]